MSSTVNCFTSLEYIGASPPQSAEYDGLLNAGISTLFPMPKQEEMHAVYKMVLQIVAHGRDPSMALHEYGRFLLEDRLASSPYYLKEEQLRSNKVAYRQKSTTRLLWAPSSTPSRRSQP